MMVWGGNGLADGASFNPATNVWTPLVAASGPGGRSGLSAVWTGTEMIVWGGIRSTPGIVYLGDGGRYGARWMWAHSRLDWDGDDRLGWSQLGNE